ncbi:hypothetical protein [Agromyces sp. LHK192]|uniref:hypothetical protein n=1 Tax=Agromyces sp. LHK192 TaxID=2498704 RepID=UPI0013E28E1B|nr:hypothetical protein [Agromyces sp. LHK192]
MSALRRIGAVSSAAIALLLLSGCTGAAEPTAESSNAATKAPATSEAPDAEGGSDGTGQAVAEACAGIQAAVADVASVDTSDPAAALEALRGASASVTEAAAAVENAEVKPAADAAATALGDYVVFLDGVMADPANADMNAMSEQITALQTSITDLGTVCAAG